MLEMHLPPLVVPLRQQLRVQLVGRWLLPQPNDDTSGCRPMGRWIPPQADFVAIFTSTSFCLAPTSSSAFIAGGMRKKCDFATDFSLCGTHTHTHTHTISLSLSGKSCSYCVLARPFPQKGKQSLIPNKPDACRERKTACMGFPLQSSNVSIAWSVSPLTGVRCTRASSDHIRRCFFSMASNGIVRHWSVPPCPLSCCCSVRRILAQFPQLLQAGQQDPAYDPTLIGWGKRPGAFYYQRCSVV